MKKKRGPKKGSKKAAEKKTKKTKKEGKKKKEKDPNAPKRPLSAFMYYSQKQRPNVKKENPSATFAEVARILGEQWKALDATLKKVRLSGTASRYSFCLWSYIDVVCCRNTIRVQQQTKPALTKRRLPMKPRRAQRPVLMMRTKSLDPMNKRKNSCNISYCTPHSFILCNNIVSINKSYPLIFRYLPPIAYKRCNLNF